MWRMGVPLPQDSLQDVQPHLTWEDFQVQLSTTPFLDWCHAVLATSVKEAADVSEGMRLCSTPASLQQMLVGGCMLPADTRAGWHSVRVLQAMPCSCL